MDNGKENGNYRGNTGVLYGLYMEQWKRKLKLLDQDPKP